MTKQTKEIQYPKVGDRLSARGTMFTITRLSGKGHSQGDLVTSYYKGIYRFLGIGKADPGTTFCDFEWPILKQVYTDKLKPIAGKIVTHSWIDVKNATSKLKKQRDEYQNAVETIDAILGERNK